MLSLFTFFLKLTRKVKNLFFKDFKVQYCNICPWQNPVPRKDTLLGDAEKGFMEIIANGVKNSPAR